MLSEFLHSTLARNSRLTFMDHKSFVCQYIINNYRVNSPVVSNLFIFAMQNSAFTNTNLDIKLI